MSESLTSDIPAAALILQSILHVKLEKKCIPEQIHTQFDTVEWNE